jgi:hypothetical protein
VLRLFDIMKPQSHHVHDSQSCKGSDFENKFLSGLFLDFFKMPKYEKKISYTLLATVQQHSLRTPSLFDLCHRTMELQSPASAVSDIRRPVPRVGRRGLQRLHMELRRVAGGRRQKVFKISSVLRAVLLQGRRDVGDDVAGAPRTGRRGQGPPVAGEWSHRVP